MSEWSVRLKGDVFDLDELYDHFHSPERNVKKDEDGHYYLRSTDFDSLADENAVRARALELVERMNWAATFHSGNSYRPVEFDVVTRIDESGKPVHHITLTAKLEGRSRMSAKPTVIREGDFADTPRPPSEVESIAALAERDERVADALRFFARGDWVNLYKAWEVVGDAAGGAHEIVNKGWADKTEQGRFTGTAQSKDELGDEARHASGKYKAPKSPMTLDEARTFVKSVIEAWVRTL
jgi:hypothetical protein